MTEPKNPGLRSRVLGIKAWELAPRLKFLVVKNNKNLGVLVLVGQTTANS
jgi:hypothetical protein